MILYKSDFPVRKYLKYVLYKKRWLIYLFGWSTTMVPVSASGRSLIYDSIIWWIYMQDKGCMEKKQNQGVGWVHSLITTHSSGKKSYKWHWKTNEGYNPPWKTNTNPVLWTVMTQSFPTRFHLLKVPNSQHHDIEDQHFRAWVLGAPTISNHSICLTWKINPHDFLNKSYPCWYKYPVENGIIHF